MTASLIALSQLHFLRPLWLLAGIPVIAIALWLWRRKSSAANWRAAIAPELIDYLLEPAQQTRPRWPWLLLAGWLLAVFALAGPSWEKLPQPVLQKRDGLVIVLDLSLSMYAEDIKPSRLQRARFKIIDILKRRREGLTGLVVYAGDAHVVSPLTDDTATIENLVPALAPDIMPEFGSDAAAGIETALQLLRNSGFERGRILLLSDAIDETDIDRISAIIDGKQWQLSILGIGTEQGAPIPLPRDDNKSGNDRQSRAAVQSGFLKQDDGTIAIAPLPRERFARLAAKTKARYDDIHTDDSDIDRLLANGALTGDSVRSVEREFDQWRERGPQLVILLLPLAALAFRRGWLLAILLVPISSPSQALEWRDLWLRPDQQAQRNFEEGNSKAAAEKFQDPQWRAAAQYRAGDYAAAAQSLQPIDTADAHYNRGNALAHAGKLQEALDAYAAALRKNPAMEDAKANRDLVEKLLKQQQEKPQNASSADNKQNEDSSAQNSASQNSASQDSASQDSASQNSAQQSQAQADSEPQNTSAQSKRDRQQSPQENRPSDAPAAQNQNTSNASEQPQDAAQTGKQNDDKADATQALQERADRNDDNEQRAAESELTPEQRMQQRATEQWLRQIPDDPAGLLRRKFIYENQQRERAPQSDDKPQW